MLRALLDRLGIQGLRGRRVPQDLLASKAKSVRRVQPDPLGLLGILVRQELPVLLAKRVIPEILVQPVLRVIQGRRELPVLRVNKER